MSNTKQIIAMLNSRAEGDDDKFFSIALQVAASEARQGHRQAAEDLRAAVEKARPSRSRGPSVAIQFSNPQPELLGLIETRIPSMTLKDVVVDEQIGRGVKDLMLQQNRRDWLREHGKTPNRKVLFVGPPGSGKTMMAEALAGQMKLPLFVIRLESLITRYMGETAAKLRLVFDETTKRRGVYLFDEFDAVGGRRDAGNDVAEMRRVLNSFLQFMEEPNVVDSILLGATNYPELLDGALLRRFDSVLKFKPPSEEEIKAIVAANLRPLKAGRLAWKKIVAEASSLSQSEIARATEDAVKTTILEQQNKVTSDVLIQRLGDRKAMQRAFVEK